MPAQPVRSQHEQRKRGRYRGKSAAATDPEAKLEAFRTERDELAGKLELESPLAADEAKHRLCLALAADLIAHRTLREQHILGLLTGEEVAKIPSVSSNIKRLSELLKLADALKRRRLADL